MNVRITFGLFFKTSPGAHLFIWKFSFTCKWKLIFIWNDEHQDWLWKGGQKQFWPVQEPMIRGMELHYILTDRFIFTSNFPGLRLPWEWHDQSQETNWRHCIMTGPELPFIHKTYTKNRSYMKIPWHTLSMELHAPTHRLLKRPINSQSKVKIGKK